MFSIHGVGIIKDLICLAVTDSGSNIVNSVHSCISKEKHFPCFTHTLDLVVQNTFDNNQNIASIINKVQSFVNFFKQSEQPESSALDELHKVCEYKLKQSVPTRRHSVYFMLNRFIICSENIASAIVKFPKGPTMLSGSELFTAKKIKSLLKPFDATT